MATKKSENTKAKTENVATKSDAEYLARAQRKGNPLILRNSASRVYSNARPNGTTGIILAALAASGAKGPEYSGEEFISGVAALSRDSFGNPDWRRLETKYSAIKGNRSSNPALKLGPVTSALVREVKSGFLRAFNAAEIADRETRALFGFNY